MFSLWMGDCNMLHYMAKILPLGRKTISNQSMPEGSLIPILTSYMHDHKTIDFQCIYISFSCTHRVLLRNCNTVQQKNHNSKNICKNRNKASDKMSLHAKPHLLSSLPQLTQFQYHCHLMVDMSYCPYFLITMNPSYSVENIE